GKFVINASDPGVVNSNMISMHRWFDPLADKFFRPFIKTPAQGAMPAINALFAKSSGNIYRKNSNKDISEVYQTHQLSEWIWKETEKLFNEKNINFLI
ncbi:MAG: oxidoreductase, partial [Bacteroidales bacterium]|nr:oxidoreductase [Bacteroidales bacterium]